MSDDPPIAVLFLGHVDHGKSTAMARFLYEIGVFTDRDIKRVTTKKGKIKWEHLLDQPEERG
jgi:translation elongation factor EF-1alpha